MIGGHTSSSDLFDTSWKFGGFNLKKLTERYEGCKLNAIAHFYQRGGK
jgi:hypothetical protein